MKKLITAILIMSMGTTSLIPIDAVTADSNEQIQENERNPELISNMQLYVGIPQKLNINNYDGNVTWISDNKNIVSVTADGTITPLRSGDVNIKAVLENDTTLICHITVKDATLSLDAAILGNLYIGNTRKLKAIVIPEAPIQWISSNKAVAKVDKNGNITAMSAGTAVIMARANGKQAQCRVTVKNKTIAIDRTKAVMYEGRTLTLHATGNPAGKPSWRSDNSAIASVNSKGKVKAEAPGTTYIRASLNGKIAVVQITVKAVRVTLNKTSCITYIGFRDKLNAKYAPSGTPSWRSDNSNIVSVDQSGNLIPKAVGKAKIRVSVNGKTATSVVTVKNPFIKFSSKTKTLFKGEKYKPGVSYAPKKGKAKWASSKKSIAKVNSSSGQITAVKEGSAYITVKINGKSAKQKIIVKNAISLKKPKITSVKKASRASLKITWKKVSGANRYYLYRSSTKKSKKTKVATVKGTTYTHKYIAGRSFYYHVKAASTNKYKYKTSGYSAAKYGKSADTMTVSTPYINQVQGGAVQGCEGASLLMALKAKGYTKMGYRDFLKGMPTSKKNPREGFIYSMYSNNPKNQVHWIDTPALAAYGKKFGKVEDISGASISKLKYEINRNRPVVVYVTAMFGAPQWKKYSYGSIPKNLHVVTLVGYNGRTGKYKINDPYFGVLWISKGQFESVYNSMKKAVVVR